MIEFPAYKFEGFLVVGSKKGDTLSLFEVKAEGGGSRSRAVVGSEMCVAGKLGSIAFPARQSYREGIASARTARVFLLEGDCYVL